MYANLSHAHRGTLDAILRRPASHNLQWRDVRSLLDAVAEVSNDSGGGVRATRNGRTLVMHPDPKTDVNTWDELNHLRAFLDDMVSTPTPSEAPGVNLLVVIDHREARIYQTELSGSVPKRITPYDPTDSGRHLHHVRDDSSGQRRPELRSYYEAVATTLHGAERILIFGSGTGASSAAEHLLATLRRHHKEVAERVIACVAIDEHHMSENELLALARENYARHSGLNESQPRP